MQTRLPQKPVNLLLVEDNEGDVLLFREAFEDSKIIGVLHVVSDGEQAVKFIKGETPYEHEPRPDLVLLDINLPKKTGLEVLASAKSSPTTSKIPVIMLTSSASKYDINQSYENHANSCIVKPLDAEGLSSTVQAIEAFWLKVAALPPIDSSTTI